MVEATDPGAMELPELESISEKTPAPLAWRETKERLYKAAGAAFGVGVFAEKNEPGFSGDAASIYTLVRNNSGEVELLKLGWGEFSHDSFTSGIYPALNQASFPIVVVSQWESHLADHETLQLMKDEPVAYLKTRGLMVAQGGEIKAQRNLLDDDEDRSLDIEIEAVAPDVLLAELRNLALEGETIGPIRRSLREQMAEFINTLPRENRSLATMLSEIYRYDYLTPRGLLEHGASLDATSTTLDYVYNPSDITDPKLQSALQQHCDKWCLDTLIEMGIETTGIAVGDEVAVASLLELINSFDQETMEFRPYKSVVSRHSPTERMTEIFFEQLHAASNSRNNAASEMIIDLVAQARASLESFTSPDSQGPLTLDEEKCKQLAQEMLSGSGNEPTRYQVELTMAKVRRAVVEVAVSQMSEKP